MEALEEDLTIEEEYAALGHAHMLLEKAYGQLADEYREKENKLHYMEPLYNKLYSRWWTRLFMAYDPYLEDRMLMRCNSCNTIFWKDSPEEFTEHVGHKYGYAQGGTRWEKFKLKMGWIK